MLHQVLIFSFFFFVESLCNLFHFPALHKLLPSILTERYLTGTLFPVDGKTRSCTTSCCFLKMYFKKIATTKQTKSQQTKALFFFVG